MLLRVVSRAEAAAASAGSPGSVGSGSADVDHSVYGAPGGKLPPPEDDDIVARQLREAAEKEPDPELKKKLWEEYWKYKGVQQTGRETEVNGRFVCVAGRSLADLGLRRDAERGRRWSEDCQRNP